jgi:hypothetical protein
MLSGGNDRSDRRQNVSRAWTVGELENALDEMYRLTVIPRRSVDRIRAALRVGESPEPYLKDIEEGMQACVDLANRMDNRPVVCPHCLGTGHPLPERQPSVPPTREELLGDG